jgi:hypothetical protein
MVEFYKLQIANTEISSSINTLNYFCNTLSHFYYTSGSRIVLIRYSIRSTDLPPSTIIIVKYTYVTEPIYTI